VLPNSLALGLVCVPVLKCRLLALETPGVGVKDRTGSDLSLTAANFAVIPGTTEGYNHAGDLSF
jgi:hypothetical protein